MQVSTENTKKILDIMQELKEIEKEFEKLVSESKRKKLK